MYLKRLEIHGFKSFAHKTILEFEPGITSIVGPNGAGKSNLADALRWVFGEQSMKLLRGKRAEDIIFAGSDKKARLGGAEVFIYFDNSDRKIPVDYSEVVISRRVYRDGNSEYLLNANQVRLLDIQDLVAKSGFGSTSYHVVGQGAIDQLILGGPAAIKDLLEEASGVKPYYLKRERTIRRLERTEANLVQIKALVEEIAPRLRSLRRQTKKLAQREALENELEEAQILHYSQIFHGLNLQIEEAKAKQEIFTKQLAELTKEIKELSAAIEEQEHKIQGRGSEYQKLRQDLEDLHQQKLGLQEELAMIRGQLKVPGVEASQTLLIDWGEVKAKFQTAYDRLVKLFENYEPQEAAKVKSIFGEILQIFTTADERTQKKKGQEVLVGKEQTLNHDLEKLFGKIKILEEDLANFNQVEQETKQQLFVKERLLRNKQETVVKTAEQKNLLDVELAKLMTRREAYEQEAATELGQSFKEKLGQKPGRVSPVGLHEKIINLKKQLAIIGGVDEMIQEEHKETEARYEYLTNQSQDLEKAIKDLRTVIAELDEVIKKEFHEAFLKISTQFSEYFRVLFNGGRATMNILRERPRPVFENDEQEEEITPSSSLPHHHPKNQRFLGDPDQGGEREGVEIVGIDIRATPPGKKLAGISALSGGERALTSIALLSAILAAYPSPFVVLDEVDAALDEANSIRFGQILGTLAHRTQFITITHNRETMRQSHTLYGVTMGEDGISKILSLKIEQAAEYSSKN
jgi:chromosome segregation protein